MPRYVYLVIIFFGCKHIQISFFSCYYFFVCIRCKQNKKMFFYLDFQQIQRTCTQILMKDYHYLLTKSLLNDNVTQYKLSLLFSKWISNKIQNVNISNYWLTKANQNGNSNAKLLLAYYYIHGSHGFEYDCKKSFDRCFQAAKNQNTNALVNLGFFYWFGISQETNLIEAFNFFLKGAEKGNIFALLLVGHCYYYGLGIKKQQMLGKLFFYIAKAFGCKQDLDQYELFCKESIKKHGNVI